MDHVLKLRDFLIIAARSRAHKIARQAFPTFQRIVDEAIDAIFHCCHYWGSLIALHHAANMPLTCTKQAKKTKGSVSGKRKCVPSPRAQGCENKRPNLK